MSGVYDHDQIFCPLCNKVTEHLTGWESEEPNVIDIQCVECYGPRMVSGYGVMETGNSYRRLIQKQDVERYNQTQLDRILGAKSRLMSARERAEQELDLR